MELYSQRQREIFQQFYEDCRARKMDPEHSEADRQRILLLAGEHADLAQLLGEGLEGGALQAYRTGRQLAEEQEAAAARAAGEAQTARQRSLDEAAAAFERALARKSGREKRLAFFQIGLDEADGMIQGANRQEDSLVKSLAHRDVTLEKESSWGTLGGIAAGITGSTAVGAAVAADTMRKNEEVRSRNAAVNQQMAEMSAAAYNSILDKKIAGKKLRESLEKEIGRVKLHLTQELPLETLMQGIALAKPEVAFTQGNTMLIRVTAYREQGQPDRIAGEVKAVVDGCFAAEVYDGNQKVGEAYLNLPRDGLGEECVLMGHCLEAAPGKSYTVVIVPLALWLMEEYTPPAISYVDYTKQGKDRFVRYRVKDLGEIIPAYQGEYAWQPMEAAPIPWERAAEERQAAWKRELEEERLAAARAAEEEKKAEEARNKALAQAEKKKRILMIAAIVAAAVILIPILIDHFF